MSRELIVDSFAGGGGASEGIRRALGHGPDIAINHDPEAIALHAANHPEARHYVENVWKVDPIIATGGQPVGLMWLSPDCKHFSKAKGGKPVSKKVRGLAWVATRWAADVKPRVIVIENVEEFQGWGPVLADGKPCPVRKGQTFLAFVRRLRRLGYAVQWRELRACDFGAPTKRKRLFIVARCDGQSIIWPTPTHGKGRPLPWRTAAECIDFSLSCPSIFDRKRPLATKTLARIARGLKRFVIDSPRPFIVNMSHGGSIESIDAPMTTVKTEKGGCRALVAPTLVQTGYGERAGQAPRSLDIEQPLGTVVAGGAKHALVAAFLAKHYGDTGQRPGLELFEPVATITASDHHALVATHLSQLNGTSTGQEVGRPLNAIAAQGGHFAEVRAFLSAYFGNEKDGADLFDPMRTVTSRDRFGLVTVEGRAYAITDIGMRMLTPRELYNAQGFGSDYRIDIQYNGKPLSKTAQVRMVGNSVCPPLAEAIVRANYGAAAVVEVAA
jgi:DNA (cytosine-5)-methyltransferase 1